MRIVGIGGGTGLPVLLRGLKELNQTGEGPIDITAIVAVSDDGGSTGALRRATGIPAMGDIRNCLTALAPDDSILAAVCQHRFDNADGLAGHAVGNLILSALYEMSGDFAGAIQQASKLLRITGRVLPSTEIPLTLCAEYEDGATVEGESNIGNGTRAGNAGQNDHPGGLFLRLRPVGLALRRPPPLLSQEGKFPSLKRRGACAESAGGVVILPEVVDPASVPRISRVYLDPPNPPAAPGVLETLENADGIVIGPGSLYTSLVPNLLVAGVPETIRSSRAIKIYVCNLMTQRGETEGYSAVDHLRAIEPYLAPGSIDVCVLNTEALGTGLAERYSKFRSEIVSGAPECVEEIHRLGVIPAAAPLLKHGGMKARHDPATLARLIVSLVRGFADVGETICGHEWNGR